MIVPFVKTYKTRVTAILSPREKVLFFDQLNADYKIKFEFLYQTAMRLREAAYFAEHPEIYRPENGLISLPRVPGLGKRACTIKARHILLSQRGMKAVRDFIDLKIKIPTYQAMDDVCKRAAKDADIKPDGMVPKMFRKWAISHQMTAFPSNRAKIAMSSGHTEGVQIEHYLIYGWKKEDVAQINEDWIGWGEAV
jgi:integrase